MNAILLIDDDASFIRQLADRVRTKIQDVEVRTWAPAHEDSGEGEAKFKSYLGDGQVQLVVTDEDLSKHGMGGLFGYTIIEWCQDVLIPVANFSRGKPDSALKEPKLFELRISTDPSLTALQIAAIYIGFLEIKQGLAALEAQADIKLRSPLSALESVLNRSRGLFDLYATRYGEENSGLSQRLIGDFTADGSEMLAEERQRIITYISGHVLLNSILRYPGPILHIEGLAAFCGTTTAETEELSARFDAARYNGPFREFGKYFWFDDVESKLQEWAAAQATDSDIETSGELNRIILERLVGRQLSRHSCTRCAGQNGGFWCPFTKRTVCLRTDCSVSATSWIPRGANLCRIERVFYDEMGPILGM